jgi:Holliday junction resolvase
MAIDADRLRRWRRRGFYSEQALVKKLLSKKYGAVRIPCSNPSQEYLPDVFASKDGDVYAFEVKKQRHYIYVRKDQIRKLFDFLDLIPIHESHKHAIIACHFGKKWKFQEIKREEFERLEDEEPLRITKSSRSNWKP